MGLKKKKEVLAENYLERIPKRSTWFQWSCDDKNKVTLYIENKGVFHWIAQKLFFKPKVSQVHLDELGSFLWPLIDGEKNIIQLGELVETKFGEEAHPLYERLVKYFQILDSYHFIEW